MKKIRSWLIGAAMAAFSLPVWGSVDGQRPEVSWADIGLRPVAGETLRFPPRAVRAGLTDGTVELLLRISPAGAVEDALVTAQTHPSFGEAALAGVQLWRFERLGQDPVAGELVVPLRLRYDSEGFVLIETFAEMETETSRGTRPASLVRGSDELGAPLVLREAVPPYYPEAWAREGITGEAVLDFFIDGKGQVRMPHTVETDHPWLASVAAEAVREWRFEPPRVEGEGAVLKVRQRFSFRSEEGE